MINNAILSILSIIFISSKICNYILGPVVLFSPKMVYILWQMALFFLTMTLCGTPEEIIFFTDLKKKKKKAQVQVKLSIY